MFMHYKKQPVSLWTRCAAARNCSQSHAVTAGRRRQRAIDHPGASHDDVFSAIGGKGLWILFTKSALVGSYRNSNILKKHLYSFLHHNTLLPCWRLPAAQRSTVSKFACRAVWFSIFIGRCIQPFAKSAFGKRRWSLLHFQYFISLMK